MPPYLQSTVHVYTRTYVYTMKHHTYIYFHICINDKATYVQISDRRGYLPPSSSTSTSQHIHIYLATHIPLFTIKLHTYIYFHICIYDEATYIHISDRKEYVPPSSATSTSLSRVYSHTCTHTHTHTHI